MVVVVPEHGGALVTECRYLAYVISLSPSITDVPVGVKFFGMKAPHQGAPIVITEELSSLAISDLVVRVLDGIFNKIKMLSRKLFSVAATNSTGLRELKCSSYSIPG